MLNDFAFKWKLKKGLTKAFYSFLKADFLCLSLSFSFIKQFKKYTGNYGSS